MIFWGWAAANVGGPVRRRHFGRSGGGLELLLRRQAFERFLRPGPVEVAARRQGGVAKMGELRQVAPTILKPSETWADRRQILTGPAGSHSAGLLNVLHRDISVGEPENFDIPEQIAADCRVGNTDALLITRQVDILR